MDRTKRTLTTIKIKTSLYIRLRKRLLEIGKSFSKWVEEMIGEYLGK